MVLLRLEYAILIFCACARTASGKMPRVRMAATIVQDTNRDRAVRMRFSLLARLRMLM
jgi:hypothetical protein